jgi:hypothetical protein
MWFQAIVSDVGIISSYQLNGQSRDALKINLIGPRFFAFIYVVSFSTLPLPSQTLALSFCFESLSFLLVTF